MGLGDHVQKGSAVKRTPMPRSTKPLPRRRGKPRPGINLRARQAYRRANPQCELSVFFPEDYLPTENGLQALVGHDDPIDPHHILTNCRADIVTNLICVRRQIHDWAERFTIDGRVLSLCVKWRKGELDTAAIEALTGVPFLGWFDVLFERLKFDVSRWAHSEVMRGLRERRNGMKEKPCWIPAENGEAIYAGTVRDEGEHLAITAPGMPKQTPDGEPEELDLDDLYETEEDALYEAIKTLDKCIRQHALDAAQLVHVRGELMERYEKIALPF